MCIFSSQLHTSHHQYLFLSDDKLTETILHTHTNYKTIDISKEADDESTELEKNLAGVLLENLTEMKKMLANVKFKRGNKTNSKEGKDRELSCSPKFIRLNIIHDLMYYLMYDYTGISDRPQEELLQELSKVCEIDDDLRKEIPNIYGKQLTSYLFIPPLKNREGSKDSHFFLWFILPYS